MSHMVGTEQESNPLALQLQAVVHRQLASFGALPANQRWHNYSYDELRAAGVADRFTADNILHAGPRGGKGLRKPQGFVEIKSDKRGPYNSLSPANLSSHGKQVAAPSLRVHAVSHTSPRTGPLSQLAKVLTAKVPAMGLVLSDVNNDALGAEFTNASTWLRTAGALRKKVYKIPHSAQFGAAVLAYRMLDPQEFRTSEVTDAVEHGKLTRHIVASGVGRYVSADLMAGKAHNRKIIGTSDTERDVHGAFRDLRPARDASNTFYFTVQGASFIAGGGKTRAEAQRNAFKQLAGNSLFQQAVNEGGAAEQLRIKQASDYAAVKKLTRLNNLNRKYLSGSRMANEVTRGEALPVYVLAPHQYVRSLWKLASGADELLVHSAKQYHRGTSAKVVFVRPTAKRKGFTRAKATKRW